MISMPEIKTQELKSESTTPENDEKALLNNKYRIAIVDSQIKNDLTKETHSEYIEDENLLNKDLSLNLFDSFSMMNSEEIKIKYELLLIENLSLKGDILNFDGELTKIRVAKELVEELQTKSIIQEKIIKELQNNNKEESSSSLELNVHNIKEEIELQELREALRTISERYEQDKENILRDCEESRQDMESQLFRLKQEKAYLESVNKDIQQHLKAALNEKEALEKEVYRVHQLVEKLKESKVPKIYQKNETDLASSLDFDLTHSFEIPETSNTFQLKSFQDAVIEQFNEISMEIQKNHHDMNIVNTVTLIKNTLVHMIKIKETLQEESSIDPNFRAISKNLSDVFSKLRLRVKNIEEESFILNRKIDEIDITHRVKTEPSFRISEREGNELIFYYKKQLQIEKAKVLEKKHVIKLHKEQISFLKNNTKEMQVEYNKLKAIYLESKEVFKNIVKKLPIFENDIEKIIENLLKVFAFSLSETVDIFDQRSVKSKND